MAAEPLRELVDDREVERLLEALRKDLPDSIHLFTRIATALRWRRQGHDNGDVQVFIYRGADEGDATDGHTTTVTVMRVEGMPEPNVALHTTDPSCAALRRVLADSQHIPWEESLRFESVHERCMPDLLAAVRAHGVYAELKAQKNLLPRDECLRLDVRHPGPGLALRPLEPRHAKCVNDNWPSPYRTEGSERMIAMTIERGPGLSWGVFTEDDPQGDPVAFIVGAWNGGQAILHTMDSHRRRGLGELVTRAACRAAATQTGFDAHAHFWVPNPASEALQTKVGYRPIFKCSWVDYTAPDRLVCNKHCHL